MIGARDILGVIETLANDGRFVERNLSIWHWKDSVDIDFKISGIDYHIVIFQSEHQGKYKAFARVNKLDGKTFYFDKAEYLSIALALTKLESKADQEVDHMFAQLPDEINSEK